MALGSVATEIEMSEGNSRGTGSIGPGKAPEGANVPKSEQTVIEIDEQNQKPQRMTWIQRMFYNPRDPNSRPFSFLLHRQFWIVFFIGQVLSWSITATNTFTTYITQLHANFPAFQTFINYALLNVVFTTFSVIRLGPLNYLRMLYRHGWKFFITSFFDVLGNYLVVKAYAYANLLSCQLINCWATIVCVALGFVFLRIRYHWTQLIGVVVCIAGLALLAVSDVLTGKDYEAADRVKGDLFMLAGATSYGISNTLEEYLAVKQPLYVVIGQMGFWGVITNGVICAIFERKAIANIPWSPSLGGYLSGYTLCLALLYILAPVMFRMSSASFYNISLLTSNFWGLIIGIKLFGYYVYWLYPVAFVLVIVGLVVYFTMLNVRGESKKPYVDYSKPETHAQGVGTYKADSAEVESNLYENRS